MINRNKPDRVWQAMRTLVLERYERRKEVCDALGMSFIRVKALLRLATEPMTLSELATQLITDPPYTTLVVDDLERRGLVERRVHPTDRRRKIVTATPAGRRAAKLAEGILGEPPAALRALPATDLAELERVLTKLLSED